MQDIEQLPLKVWAEQLAHARNSAGLDVNSLARELLLSASQIRGIESGSLNAFHGPGYYLRAVEKLAKRLGVVLDPPMTELKLTDSQLALNRVKNNPSAAPLAKRQSNLVGADTMPVSNRRSAVATWMTALVLLLVATGVWLATQEGWPNKDVTPLLATSAPNTTDTAPSTVQTIEQNRLAELASSTNPAVQERVVAEPLVQESPREAIETKPIDSASGQVSDTAPDSVSTLASDTTFTNPENQPAVAISPEPTPLPPAIEVAANEPPPVVTVDDTLEATFDADCWVEVRFVDGRIEQAIYKPGQSFTVLANEVDRLTFGNAQAVQATRAGESFDILRFTRAGNNVARISAEDLSQN